MIPLVGVILVAVYCRVSTAGEDQANSYNSQIMYFVDYIARQKGWVLYKVYEDYGISGTSTENRTGFLQMLEDAYQGKFHIIITKDVSRFSRNILDTIRYTRHLKEHGVGVIFTNEGINTLLPEDESRMVFMGTFAQEESRKISDRVTWGQTRSMENGVVFGRSLLGYDVKDGRMTINSEGAKLVELIFCKYALEQMGTAQIAKYLNANGYCTLNGNRWTTSGIIKILKNEKYVGDLVQKKTYTPNYLDHAKRTNHGEVPMVVIHDHHEPIISRDLWEMTQERLQNNNKHNHTNTGHSNRYIFSGKIKCGVCGSSFVGRYKYLKGGERIKRWSCGTAAYGGTAACNVGKQVRDDDAIHMMRTAIQSLPMDREKIAADLAKMISSVISKVNIDPADSHDKTRREMEKIQKKIDALLDLYLDGDITKTEMLSKKAQYNDALAALGDKLEQTENKDDNAMDAAMRCDTLKQDIMALLSGELVTRYFIKTFWPACMYTKTDTWNCGLITCRRCTIFIRLDIRSRPSRGTALCTGKGTEFLFCILRQSCRNMQRDS